MEPQKQLDDAYANGYIKMNVELINGLCASFRRILVTDGFSDKSADQIKTMAMLVESLSDATKSS